MARLNTAPAQLSLFSSSSSASKSDASPDAEAAAQQLLNEERVSATKTPDPPHTTGPMATTDLPSSAHRGAELLNAALKFRLRHSSPARAPPSSGTGNGKLARVKKGLFTEPRQQLGGWREREWDVPDSPEKGPFRLPEKVNQKPLKVVKKKPAQQTVHSDTVAPSSDLSESSQHLSDGDDQEEPAEQQMSVPSSPPQVASALNRADEEVEQSANDSDADDVQIEEYLPNGSARCSATSYKEGKGYEQCRRKGQHATADGLRCTIHMGKPGRSRCHYVLIDDEAASRCPKPELNWTGRCAKHATVEEPQEPVHGDDQAARQPQAPADDKGVSRRGAKRKSAEAHDPEDRATKSRRGNNRSGSGRVAEEAQSGTKRKGRPKKWASTPPPEDPPVRARRTRGAKSKGAQEAAAEAVKKVGPREQANATARPRSAKTSSQRVAKGTASGTSSRREPEVDADGEEQEEDEEDQVDDDEEDDAHDHVEKRTAKRQLGTMERVFEFLDLEERDGSCQTKLGTTLNRVCQKTSSHLEGEDLSIEETTDDIKDVLGVLKQVGEFGKDVTKDCSALKQDMFGYVFRSLATVLQALYESFRATDENFEHSLLHMRIITRLMRSILDVKQSIAGWKVKTAQRYRGDRVIRDVESFLIVPLREVHKVYRNQLSQLESREELLQQAARLRREVEEREEEHARQGEAKRTRNERKKRWQRLHVTRMECEPDMTRRWRLRTTKFIELEETDANGHPIERVQVFGARTNPPPSWAAQMAAEVDWPDEAEEALIDGLQIYAGADVFHHIFRAYCGLGGILRDFSVAQIVAKAMWVKDAMRKMHQANVEEMPHWVERMPSLP